MKVNPSRLLAVVACIRVMIANMAAANMVNACVTIRKNRRSTMSASAPPGSASRNTGRMVAACTMETTIGLGSSEVISQPAPVFCSQVPSQTTTLASHSRRNIRWRNGSSAGGSLIGAHSTALSVQQVRRTGAAAFG